MYPKDLKQLSNYGTNIDQLFSVRDKVVLVTGAGRGIGLMIAAGFIENGATVFISGRDEKTLKEAAAELNSKGPGKCFAIACNVAKPEEIKVNKDKKLF